MENVLKLAGNVAILLFLGEMLVCLLPVGNMKRFCKFALSIVLTLCVFSALLGLGEVELPALSASAESTETNSYEDVILDVYNKYFENKNE